MRIGITGATGFIGRNLVNRLLLKGHNIKALVIEDRPNLPKVVKSVKGDLTLDKNIDKFLKNVDILFHLAGRFNPPESQMMNDNVIGTYNLINHALNSSIKKIIFISSVAVYGKDNNKKYKESDICNPDTIYGLSKLMTEELINFWSKKTGNQSIIFRPFNIYGPLNYQGVVFDLYSSIIKNKKVEIFGDGKQKRSLIFIDDLIEIFESVVDKKIQGIFNLSSDKKYSVLNLLKEMDKIIKSDYKIVYDHTKKARVYDINQDSGLAMKKLGWSAKTNLSVGLKKTISWYLENQ